LHRSASLCEKRGLCPLLLVTLPVCRYLLKIRFMHMLRVMTGGMRNTPGLARIPTLVALIGMILFTKRLALRTVGIALLAADQLCVILVFQYVFLAKKAREHFYSLAFLIIFVLFTVEATC